MLGCIWATVIGPLDRERLRCHRTIQVRRGRNCRHPLRGESQDKLLSLLRDMSKYHPFLGTRLAVPSKGAGEQSGTGVVSSGGDRPASGPSMQRFAGRAAGPSSVASLGCVYNHD